MCDNPQILPDRSFNGVNSLTPIEFARAAFFANARQVRPTRICKFTEPFDLGVDVSREDFLFLVAHYPRPEQFLDVWMERKRARGFAVASRCDTRSWEETGRWRFTDGLTVVAGSILGRCVESLTDDLWKLRSKVDNCTALSTRTYDGRTLLLACQEFPAPTNALSFITGSRQAPETYFRNYRGDPVILA